MAEVLSSILFILFITILKKFKAIEKTSSDFYKTEKRIGYIYVFLNYDKFRMNYLVFNYAGKDSGGIISLICFISLL